MPNLTPPELPKGGQILVPNHWAFPQFLLDQPVSTFEGNGIIVGFHYIRPTSPLVKYVGAGWQYHIELEPSNSMSVQRGILPLSDSEIQEGW